MLTGRYSCALALTMMVWSCLPGAATALEEPRQSGGRPRGPAAVLDFRAIGDDGQPVVDLRVPDVALKVDGKTREIRSLQLVRIVGSEAAASQPALPAPFSTNSQAESGRDLLLVRGPEPNMRWRQFAALLSSALTSANVTRVHLLCALLADVPHTRPIPVSTSSSTVELGDQLGLLPSTYEGPTGIVGVLSDSLGTIGVPCLSLWAAVPAYVAHPPCPKATYALLSQLERLIDAPLDFGDLPDLAKAWERGVNELAAEDSEVAEYVSNLEASQDATELPEASGDAIAAEFERYLRRRGGS